MTLLVQQSTAATPLPFYLTSSADHISGLTGKAGTVVVKISKNGASGVTPSGAISEIDATNHPGLYQIAANITDSNTLGYLWVTASVAGADPSDQPVAQIVAFNPNISNFFITSSVKRNSPLTGFMFVLTDSTNHNPKIGATGFTTLIAQDGNPPVATAGAPTEVGDGVYAINLQGAELNFVNIMLILTAAGCDTTYSGFITQP